MSAPTESSEESRLQRLQDILASGAMREATRLLRSLAPAEIANLLESLPAGEREIIWNLVDEEQDGQILLLVTDEVRASLIRHMDTAELLAATEKLDLDDLADLVQQMPAAITAQVMDALDDQRRNRLEAVLSYSEDTAGGLMNLDTVTVRPEVTLDVVLRYLRRLGDNVPSDTDKLFVVNRDDSYLGVLRLSQLVSDFEEDLEEIRRKARVVVLGQIIKEDLFGDAGGVVFTVAAGDSQAGAAHAAPEGGVTEDLAGRGGEGLRFTAIPPKREAPH